MEHPWRFPQCCQQTTIQFESRISWRYFPQPSTGEFWQVESLETLKETCCTMSGEYHEGLKIINTAILFADGQYQIGLLSKHEDPHLLFNRSLAETCLKALKGRFYPLSAHCLNLLVFSVHFFFPSKLFFSSYGELMLHGKIRYKNLSPCLMLPIWRFSEWNCTS